jgi:hypothetical protein
VPVPGGPGETFQRRRQAGEAAVEQRSYHGQERPLPAAGGLGEGEAGGFLVRVRRCGGEGRRQLGEPERAAARRGAGAAPGAGGERARRLAEQGLQAGGVEPVERQAAGEEPVVRKGALLLPAGEEARRPRRIAVLRRRRGAGSGRRRRDALTQGEGSVPLRGFQDVVDFIAHEVEVV